MEERDVVLGMLKSADLTPAQIVEQVMTSYVHLNTEDYTKVMEIENSGVAQIVGRIIQEHFPSLKVEIHRNEGFNLAGYQLIAQSDYQIRLRVRNHRFLDKKDEDEDEKTPKKPNLWLFVEDVDQEAVKKAFYAVVKETPESLTAKVLEKAKNGEWTEKGVFYGNLPRYLAEIYHSMLGGMKMFYFSVRTEYGCGAPSKTSGVHIKVNTPRHGDYMSFSGFGKF